MYTIHEYYYFSFINIEVNIKYQPVCFLQAKYLFICLFVFYLYLKNFILTILYMFNCFIFMSLVVFYIIYIGLSKHFSFLFIYFGFWIQRRMCLFYNCLYFFFLILVFCLLCLSPQWVEGISSNHKISWLFLVENWMYLIQSRGHFSKLSVLF